MRGRFRFTAVTILGLTALLTDWVLLRGQVPERDSRITRIPNTNTRFQFPQYHSLEEWRDRALHLRRQLLSAAGLLPLPAKTPLNAMVFDRIERGDYTIEKVLLQTLPGFFLAGNLYRPVGRHGRFPGILSPHGHWERGRLENIPSYSVPALGVSMARQGYVVFAYDMVGYSDTRQTPHDFGGWREKLYSFTPMGLQLWNSIRAVDFLESLPDVDRNRLGATGASGGGTQTFLLAAVDSRIRAAAPVNMISAVMQGGDPCEDAPGLRFDTFNVELAALIAPRPMLMVSSSGDWTRNTPTLEFPAMQQIYSLFGKRNMLQNAHFQVGHNYNRASREAVYAFFAHRLARSGDSIDTQERDFTPEQDKDMLVFPNGGHARDALSYEGVFDAWKRATAQPPGIRSRNSSRLRMQYALGVEWPERVWDTRDDEWIWLSRVGREDRVPGIWIPGKGQPVLIVHPDGAEAARKSEQAKLRLEAGRPVLMIDVFGSGAAKGTRDESDRYFLTYNRTVSQNRVQDILTALAYLKAGHSRAVELVGIGDAAIWATFAAAVCRESIQLTADATTFTGTDDDFHHRFFVPGIQRAGGLQTARALAAGR